MLENKSSSIWFFKMTKLDLTFQLKVTGLDSLIQEKKLSTKNKTITQNQKELDCFKLLN